MKLIKRRNFKEKQRVDESLSLLYQSPLKLELKQNCSREGERERENLSGKEVKERFLFILS